MHVNVFISIQHFVPRLHARRPPLVIEINVELEKRGERTVMAMGTGRCRRGLIVTVRSLIRNKEVATTALVLLSRHCRRVHS